MGGGGSTGISFVDSTMRLGEAGGDLWGDISGQNAARQARRDQQQGADRALSAEMQMFNQQREDFQPWREAGETALGGLQDPNFGKNLEMDPGYQFRMSEGMKAINNSMGARGMANSGAAMKALTKYGQDYASNEYDKSYNRQFNRLSSLAGLGSAANAGAAQAAGNYGQSVSNIYTGMGNANAASRMGTYNAMMGLAGQGAQAAGMAYGGGVQSSDKRLKTNIIKLKVSKFKDVPTYEFEYKDKSLGEGRFTGVMAQDLLAIDPNHPAVINTAKGYAVNYNLLEKAE